MKRHDEPALAVDTATSAGTIYERNALSSCRLDSTRRINMDDRPMKAQLTTQRHILTPFHSFRSFVAGFVAAAAMLCLLQTSLVAQIPTQGGPSDGSGSADFVFAGPLKNDILYSYKYTERVRVWILDKTGAVTDSSDRLLTYFLTERQTSAEIGGGAKVVEANIDSMHLEYHASDGDVDFNTQNIDHANDRKRINHPAVLVPSALVNAVGHFTLSPYGSLGDVTGTSIESVRRQGEDPMLDDFTQKRIEHMFSDDYLATVFFPWRSAVPLGRIVRFGDKMELPIIAGLDRITFRDEATVVVTEPDKELGAGVIDIHAELSHPTTEWVTFDVVPHPVLVKDASGVLTGQLFLDEDGVVQSGWTSTTGTMAASFSGNPVNARIEHQVFVERMNMISFPGF